MKTHHPMNFTIELEETKRKPIIMDKSFLNRLHLGSGCKMDKIFTVILILLPLLCETLPARAQNPFISKESPQQVLQAPSLPNPFLNKITIWQQMLKQRMTILTKKSKRDRQSTTPVLPAYYCLCLRCHTRCRPWSW